MCQNPTHTNSQKGSSQKGPWGGDEREGERGDGRRGEARRRGVESRGRRKWESGLPYTPNGVGKLRAPLAVTLKKKTDAAPTTVFLPLRTVECVSPHMLLLPLPTACWQAPESTCSDSHHPLPPPSTQLLCTRGVFVPPPPPGPQVSTRGRRLDSAPPPTPPPAASTGCCRVVGQGPGLAPMPSLPTSVTVPPGADVGEETRTQLSDRFH